MVRFISTIAVVASVISLAAAQSYSNWELDDTAVVKFASPIIGIEQVDGDVIAGKAACDKFDECLAVICRADEDDCFTLRYSESGISDSGGEIGFTSIHFRYDAPFGPSCSLLLDEFINSSGLCECGSELEVQDTGFGCRKRSAASQLPQIQITRRSRMAAAAHVRRAYSERQRGTGNGGLLA